MQSLRARLIAWKLTDTILKRNRMQRQKASSSSQLGSSQLSSPQLNGSQLNGSQLSSLQPFSSCLCKIQICSSNQSSSQIMNLVKTWDRLGLLMHEWSEHEHAEPASRHAQVSKPLGETPSPKPLGEAQHHLPSSPPNGPTTPEQSVVVNQNEISEPAHAEPAHAEPAHVHVSDDAKAMRLWLERSSKHVVDLRDRIPPLITQPRTAEPPLPTLFTQPVPTYRALPSATVQPPLARAAEPL